MHRDLRIDKGGSVARKTVWNIGWLHGVACLGSALLPVILPSSTFARESHAREFQITQSDIDAAGPDSATPKTSADDAAEPDSTDPGAEQGTPPAQTQTTVEEKASPAPGDGTPRPAGDADDPAHPPAGGDNVILRDINVLPDAVRTTWQALVAVAKSGDISRLQPIIAAQPQPPTFAFAQVDEPIEYLKSLSGDPAGREVLAILLEILETGFVHVDAGTDQEMYLWPYFARYPVSRLTPEETVEMFTILTAGDYQDMLSYGAYIFFRVGIGPDGAWHFFVAGD